MNVKIELIKNNKKDYLYLLLIGDESEMMIDKYLKNGSLYVLFKDSKAVSCAVITEGTDSVCELKNLATLPEFQNKGYASILLDYIFKNYSKRFNFIAAGTGYGSKNVLFYKQKGFIKSRIIKNFFIENYPQKIIENNRQIKDMIYLIKKL